jgi:hypothetical protein
MSLSLNSTSLMAAQSAGMLPPGHSSRYGFGDGGPGAGVSFLNSRKQNAREEMDVMLIRKDVRRVSVLDPNRVRRSPPWQSASRRGAGSASFIANLVYGESMS